MGLLTGSGEIALYPVNIHRNIYPYNSRITGSMTDQARFPVPESETGRRAITESATSEVRATNTGR
jgi:hypothetical protein